MKKLLSLSPSKIFICCGLGLLMTLGAFWHHQSNQTQLDRMNVLNQGVGTCFNRISQTFTAVMIRDVKSPYLQQGFMSLSDECLNETIKGINPFRQNVGRGYETLNRLLSEVSWFHEKILRNYAPATAAASAAPLAPISDRFTKMENLKISLVDVIDETSSKLKEIQANDEFLMGAGLIIFVISLSLLSLQEFNRLQLQREIEREALNLLRVGQANVGAMVDKLVERGLVSQNMPVTAQIFRDYHEAVLERMSMGQESTDEPEAEAEATVETVEAEAAHVAELTLPMQKTSLKEVLVSLQNLHQKNIQISEVRDVQLAVAYESLEQMLNSAMNKLLAYQTDNKKILIANQIHSDRTVINMFLAGSVFTAADLEFASGTVTDVVDTNLLILKEMVTEAKASWHLENKTDRTGKITGMNIRFTINRVPKDTRAKNLISVVKGKKKDLTREMMN